MKNNMEDCDSVRNHTDVLISHTGICAGASQIPLMAKLILKEFTSCPSSRKRSGMEIKMKKITAILLVIMMTLSLAACAGGGGSVGNSQDTELQQIGTENVQMPEESQAQEQTEASDEKAEASGQPDVAPDIATSPDSSTSEPASEPEGSKILVAYFSATNNTEGVAQKLADGLGADLYEIVPEQPYTDEDLDYGNSESRSSVEMNDPSARPAISGSVENMEQYDVVLIGYAGGIIGLN